MRITKSLGQKEERNDMYLIWLNEIIKLSTHAQRNIDYNFFLFFLNKYIKILLKQISNTSTRLGLVPKFEITNKTKSPILQKRDLIH